MTTPPITHPTSPDVSPDMSTDVSTDQAVAHDPTTRQAARPRPLHDAGMATAEYAIATLAACGFAGLLVVLLRGGEVQGLLSGVVRRALTVD